MGVGLQEDCLLWVLKGSIVPGEAELGCHPATRVTRVRGTVESEPEWEAGRETVRSQK